MHELIVRCTPVVAQPEGYGLQLKGTGFSPYISSLKTAGFSP
jgi:hypothetical protein